MKPTAIILEIVPSNKAMAKYAANTARLRAIMPGSLNGFAIIDSTPIASGKSLPGFRKQGEKYAKRFGIQFTDLTA